ncbi:glycosyltransferase family 2 protein [Shewanella xiamenensis]|uniref:glycosyltransferase family 2 protein n=1 Tax=Shewanella xiamenensis TaxID=332186 RepID=UPI0021BEA0C2|nr:glycosyltransferase family 2 protein [Shewanella xiamenensis]MCT8876897.1 glycosyltransferase family 2 protein [Shewanella xiamenensis]
MHSRSNQNIFAFIVLVYNHEKYIIEHLESIKYLIERYGKDYQVDISISDDGSTDRSKVLVQKWLKHNSNLFRNIDTLFNSSNIGTCKCVHRLLSNLKKDITACKITAGDDIYSYENIFTVCSKVNDFSFLSGIPLHFTDSSLFLDKFYLYGMFATQSIYNKKPLIDRFKLLSVTNAPNLFYNTDLLMSNETLGFLLNFDVVEDWPIQISISKLAGERPFLLDSTIYVYYRRTLGSSYIIANNRFYSDKVKVFDYLIEGSKSRFEKLILKNRKWIFTLNIAKLNKFFNLSFYIFTASSIFRFLDIIKMDKIFEFNLAKHNSHLNTIKVKAVEFLNEFNEN